MLCSYIFSSAGFIYSYRSEEVFLLAEGGNLTNSNHTLFGNDVKMESKYLGFGLPIKAIAFIPSLAAFVAFVVTIIIYGRVKPTKSDPYGGRLQKIPKRKNKMSLFTIVRMKFMRKKTEPDSGDAGRDVVDGNYKSSNAEEYQLTQHEGANANKNSNNNGKTYSSNNSITIWVHY